MSAIIWTKLQAAEAVGTYLESTEAKRVLKIFQGMSDPELAFFEEDMRRRTKARTEAARKWWELIRKGGENLVAEMALAEPLARNGWDLDDLYKRLPTKFSANALVMATDAIPQFEIWGKNPSITNTVGWSDEQIQTWYQKVLGKLDWENTTGSARNWWLAFEKENLNRFPLVLRLAEELAIRNATITEFFLAYVHSNTDNIQAILHYLDYTRLKRKEEREKREKAEQPNTEREVATK